MRVRGVALALAAVLVLGACVHQVPPPAAPELVVPKPLVPLGPPAAGEGVVLIDTVGEPADVVEVVGVGSARQTRPLCTTPCEAHVQLGYHELEFHTYQRGDWRGDGRVTVGQRPVAYRYALGHTTLTAGTASLLTFGGILALSGGGLAIGGLVGGSVPITAIAGALLALGLGGMYAYRPDVQAGTGVEWTP